MPVARFRQPNQPKVCTRFARGRGGLPYILTANCFDGLDKTDFFAITCVARQHPQGVSREELGATNTTSPIQVDHTPAVTMLHVLIALIHSQTPLQNRGP